MDNEQVKAWAVIDERNRMHQIFFNEWFADDFTHKANTDYYRQLSVRPVIISPVLLNTRKSIQRMDINS